MSITRHETFSRKLCEMEEPTVKSTHVAYGCDLNTTIDYRCLVLLLTIDSGATHKRGTLNYGVRGVRGLGIVRGNVDSTGMMKHCAIVDFWLREQENNRQASVKVFQGYLHFCGDLTVELADMLGDVVVELILKIQSIISTPELLTKRIDEIMREPKSYITAETRPYLEEKLPKAICVSSLQKRPVKPTMSNHSADTGHTIHPTRLVKFLQKERPNWILSYDNAISLVVDVSIVSNTIPNHYYKFSISPNGKVAYNSNEETEEAIGIRHSLFGTLKEYAEG